MEVLMMGVTENRYIKLQQRPCREKKKKKARTKWKNQKVKSIVRENIRRRQISLVMVSQMGLCPIRT